MAKGELGNCGSAACTAQLLPLDSEELCGICAACVPGRQEDRQTYDQVHQSRHRHGDKEAGAGARRKSCLNRSVQRYARQHAEADPERPSLEGLRKDLSANASWGRAQGKPDRELTSAAKHAIAEDREDADACEDRGDASKEGHQ